MLSINVRLHDASSTGDEEGKISLTFIWILSYFDFARNLCRKRDQYPHHTSHFKQVSLFQAAT
jgi:hypothetical protein